MRSRLLSVIVLACLLGAFYASAAVHFVDINSLSPTAPYASWATAARGIQDAVDVAQAGDEILVTNGVYQTGARLVRGNLGSMSNRVAIVKPLTVRSVNGPDVTFIRGYQVPGTTNGTAAIRCVYLTNDAFLVGFTLTNGATHSTGDWLIDQCGGGVWCESVTATLSNCVLSGNSASACGGGAHYGTLNNCLVLGNSANYGGGVYYGGGFNFGTLNNCVLMGNLARNGGGGVFGGTLNNCTVSGNAAALDGGGGVYGAKVNNSVVYFNTGSQGANYFSGAFNYSCTTPLPTGIGNFTNAPGFINDSVGNFRLQMNSPCINSGLNVEAPAGSDLDGNSRIAGSAVDVGAYELQTPQSVLSYVWLQRFGLAIDGSADFADSDADGLNNWQEWRAGTDPVNSASALRLLSVSATNSGITVLWQSATGRTYFLERSTNLPSFVPLVSNISGESGTTAYIDTNAVGKGPFFYRVGFAD